MGLSEEMFALVDQWKSSGLSRKDFSRINNLSLHKFVYWLRRYRLQGGDYSKPNLLATKSISPILPKGAFEEFTLPSFFDKGLTQQSLEKKVFELSLPNGLSLVVFE